MRHSRGKTCRNMLIKALQRNVWQKCNLPRPSMVTLRPHRVVVFREQGKHKMRCSRKASTIESVDAITGRPYLQGALYFWINVRDPLYFLGYGIPFRFMKKGAFFLPRVMWAKILRIFSQWFSLWSSWDEVAWSSAALQATGLCYAPSAPTSLFILSFEKKE